MAKFSEMISKVSIGNTTLPILCKINSNDVEVVVNKRSIKVRENDHCRFHTWEDVIRYWFNLENKV